MSLQMNRLVGFNVSGGLPLNGLQLHIDIGNDTCYPNSGQNITDLSPNTYGFWFGDTSGATATDPTYIAGPPEYLGFSGGQQITSAAAHAGSLHRRIGRQDQPFTLIMWVYRGPVANTDEIGFGNGTIGGATTLFYYVDYTSNRQEINLNGSSQGTAGTQVSVGSWKMVGCMGQADGSQGYWILDRAKEVGWSLNNTGWTTGDSGDTQVSLCSNLSRTVPFQNGSRCAVILAFSRVISDAEIAQIYDYYRGRFGV